MGSKCLRSLPSLVNVSILSCNLAIFDCDGCRKLIFKMIRTTTNEPRTAANVALNFMIGRDGLTYKHTYLDSIWDINSTIYILTVDFSD